MLTHCSNSLFVVAYSMNRADSPLPHLHEDRGQGRGVHHPEARRPLPGLPPGGTELLLQRRQLVVELNALCIERGKQQLACSMFSLLYMY